jgi:hypothetical protein
MTKLLDFLVDNKFRSYENFLYEIKKNKPNRQKVISVVQQLVVLRWNKKVREICTNKEMTAEGGEIYFLFNICWFYRWLLSEGYPYVYKDDCIEMVRKFIAYIAIPGYVSREIKWSMVFGNFATFNEEDKKVVFEEIMDRFPPAKEMKTFSEIIDCWLAHHVILRIIVEEKRRERRERKEEEKRREDEKRKERKEEEKSWIDLYMEKILMNYISLVDAFPELEEDFGVAIEKDMEIVYNGIKDARAGSKR